MQENFVYSLSRRLDHCDNADYATVRCEIKERTNRNQSSKVCGTKCVTETVRLVSFFFFHFDFNRVRDDHGKFL